MNEKFFDLRKEKQDRMISGFVKVFARKGYADASCEELAREAGISKGLLFHYFETKQGAYLFLCGVLYRYLEMEVGSRIPHRPADPFTVMEQVQTGLCEIMRHYPYAGLFVFRLEADVPGELPEGAQEYRERCGAFCTQIRKAMDFSSIPRRIGSERLLRILKTGCRGLIMEMLETGEKSGHAQGAPAGEIFDAGLFRKESVIYLELLALSVGSVGGVSPL
ncbi:MAG: TetR/AcrR family transcriptional regulator [Lachnospiraceae bacterium]|nr:TetR/AcrR family transcriptional regulator [Lachnospiraceae bacterium]